MRTNTNQFMSFEAIAHQDTSFFILLSSLIKDYKEKKTVKRDFETKVVDAIKKRFNINVKFKVDPANALNAYMCPYSLSGTHALDSRRFREYGEYAIRYMQAENNKDNYKIVKQILKGDLSTTGLLDYKKARVSGLFAELPPVLSVCYQGTIDQLLPEETAAIIIHEIGHYWTYLEWLGILTFRNAVITNAVSEFLQAGTEQEKFQVILAQKNVWGLKVNEGDVAKLNDENATKIIMGAYHVTYKNSVGFVQYDDNASEVIADQFSQRMGSGKNLSSAMFKLYKSSGRTDESKLLNKYVWKGALLTTLGVILGIHIVAVGGLLGTIGTLVSACLTFMGVNSVLTGLFGLGDMVNGSAYDTAKNRLERMYREEVQRLKHLGSDPEIANAVLSNLAEMKKHVEACSAANKSWGTNLLRFFSPSFREQENIKHYQSLVEEMLANQLYITSAKFKTLGVQ